MLSLFDRMVESKSCSFWIRHEGWLARGWSEVVGWLGNG